ncbi:dTDP-glucose 4,6-dehydratase [Candidatus Roizmanbacteria bacterium CG_4_10_14_0_2_um_filter_36_9]|uniref:dTDP-glucose 4,6-dehydratase n=2 Tax=Candidatus Roizmaniibacteriota TaxID=1752723 RepID=A0A2M7U3I1_9BACT|nr:MAG: dTDP-glucose 4,6-dehydratase [Candidatus Roizmanbacteria bacterium CG_4_10_14_0_2_um_filter_36_9]
MKLLVTGGAGFIGANFIHYWLKNHPNDHIVNFDKLTYAGHLSNLKNVENSPNYHFVQGDIVDKKSVEEVMSGIDTVIHFAAESHVDRSIADAYTFVMTNVVGTQVLLDSALKNNVKRFHHISTDEVFGALELGSDEKFNVNTIYDPHSPYAASKAGSDHLVRAYHDTYGLPITISNCSNNFGPYMHPEKLIPLAITNLIQGKKVPVYGDGKYVRDWLYVEDHCRAIEMILRNGKVGKTYLVGGQTEDISNLEVIKIILKIMNDTEESIKFVTDRKGHDRRYAIDWSVTKDELGWEPKYDFDTALNKTIEWYKNNEDWWKTLI